LYNDDEDDEDDDDDDNNNNNNNNSIQKSKSSLRGKKSKICTFTMVMPLGGGKNYIYTYIRVAYN
jgi:hypothetical protein